jgi:hypothetical protein
MLGGITFVPPAPGIRCMPPRPVPPPRPIAPREPMGDIAREPAREKPGPPDIADIPPDSGDRLNDVREELIAAVGRDRKDSVVPPPMRLGMNPSNMPP